jgi:hypothetical protein
MSLRPHRSRTVLCHDCGGEACRACGFTGKADMTEDERAEYDDAMERRAEARADDAALRRL